jgi:hypothetical protein
MSEDTSIKVGDTVTTGVYVLGEWKGMQQGVVVSQSSDGSVSDVDVMSLHGGQPWIRKEVTSHLRRATKPVSAGANNE